MLNKLFYVLYDFHKSKIRFIIITAITLLTVILALNTKIDNPKKIFIFDILSFPFKIISDILKSLSLSSKLGNVIALILFTLISFLPVLIYLVRKLRKKEKICFIDVLFTLIISALIGISLYYHINPSLIKSQIDVLTDTNAISNLPIHSLENDDMNEYLKLFQKIVNLGFIYITLIFSITYFVYLFYKHTKKEKLNLFKASGILLNIQKIVYVFLYLITFFLIPLVYKDAYSKTNVKNEQFLIILECIFIFSTLIITLIVIRFLHDLLLNFKAEILFSEDNVMLLKKCSYVYFLYVLITLLYQFIYNGYQLLNTDKLANISITFTIPYTPIVLALIFYLLSLIMNQSYEIYKENSLTI